MTAGRPVVTGVGLAVNGFPTTASLIRTDPVDDGPQLSVDLTGAALRHKDRASRLALRSVERALSDAGLNPGPGDPAAGATMATVVSSNFGNLDSVCEFTDRITEVSSAGLSALGLPHVSSNVIAGWIAIRHGLRGPNITLCNGHTSGIDALYWADNLISVGRADLVVVVGVEPDTRPVRRLLGGAPEQRVLDGAAAVVLESPAHTRGRRATPRAVLASHTRAAHLDTVITSLREAPEQPGLWLTPPALPPGRSPVPALDLTGRLGDCSGALGVLQCVAAIAFLEGGGSGPVYATCGGGPGGVATLQIDSPHPLCSIPRPATTTAATQHPVTRGRRTT